MKYYSETLNALYDTEQELIKAETKAKEEERKKLEAEKAKKNARATKAKEVEQALKEANEAQAKAIKLLKEFTNEYGYFHMSYSTDDVKNKTATKNENNTYNVDSFFDLLGSFLQG